MTPPRPPLALGPVATLDARAVLALLAHRYPLLLVDRIDVVERGVRVRGHRRVTGGEWAAGGPGVAGWLPGMPGLLAVEALAQTSAALLLDLVSGAEGVVGYFAALERVRLRDPARVGDALHLDVTLRSFRRGIAKLRGAATVDDGAATGRLVASADFTALVRAGG